LSADTQENFSVTTVGAHASDTIQGPPKYKSEVLLPEPIDLFPNDWVNLCQHVTYFRDFLVQCSIFKLSLHQQLTCSVSGDLPSQTVDETAGTSVSGTQKT
jgi:hypothetical protein